MTTNRDRARDLIGASADCIEVELDEAELRGAQRERERVVADLRRFAAERLNEGSYMGASYAGTLADRYESGTHAKEEA